MVNNLTVGRISQRLEAVGHANALNIEALATFVDLLAKWNRKINLTSLDLEPLTDEAIDRLVVEPVVGSRFAPKPVARIIDLGSGGGSPAIPFQLQLPETFIRMVESRSRKCAFLREVVRTLDLQRSTVEESRFEALLERQELLAGADLITVRAVRLDDQLVRLIRFLLSPSGRVYRFSTRADDPVSAGLELVSAHQLSEVSDLQILKLA